MADFDDNRFASKNQVYETPEKLFNVLNNEFGFTLDVCATDENRKVDNFIGEDIDSLTQDWNGICWMNPPYKDMKKWIIKAYKETIRNENTVVVCLIPARTNTTWWHDYCMKGEIRFIKGRPKFKGCIHGLPQPLAIVIFGKEYKNNYGSVIF